MHVAACSIALRRLLYWHLIVRNVVSTDSNGPDLVEPNQRDLHPRAVLHLWKLSEHAPHMPDRNLENLKDSFQFWSSASCQLESRSAIVLLHVVNDILPLWSKMRAYAIIYCSGHNFILDLHGRSMHVLVTTNTYIFPSLYHQAGKSAEHRSCKAKSYLLCIRDTSTKKRCRIIHLQLRAKLSMKGVQDHQLTFYDLHCTTRATDKARLKTEGFQRSFAFRLEMKRNQPVNLAAGRDI